jgi:hypothetical protein
MSFLFSKFSRLFVPTRIRRCVNRSLVQPQVIAVKRNSQRLRFAQQLYQAFPDVVFIFQFFNTRRNCGPVLSRFLERGCKNIILFADGCIDGTSKAAHRLLCGQNHYVISANDRHEIANYRLGLKIGESLGCKYAVLLQDDDVYDDSLFLWISANLALMKNERISIVGGCSGCDLDPKYVYKQADSGFCTAEFVVDQTSPTGSWSLGTYQRMIICQPRNAVNGLPRVYAATVSRAPQIIDINVATKLGFFPTFLEPYQYDDDYNSFLSWLSGYKVLFCPVSGKQTIGLSGMRLYNDVSEVRRPHHFANNWNTILSIFSEAIHSGEFNRMVEAANASIPMS